MVMSLGELRCSQVGTRPGGAIQGHRGNMVILHNLVWEADNESKKGCRHGRQSDPQKPPVLGL